MIRIRVFEERCAELYGESKIRGFLHLYIGEEAVATGVISCLQPDDSVLATYREHGHALLRGVSAESIMAEMFGKATGCSGGRGGSMHLFDARDTVLRRQRDRRRTSATRRRARTGRPDAGSQRGCDRVLLRGGRHGRGRVPRGDEPGRTVERSGAVLLREQSLCDGDIAEIERVADRPAAQGRQLRDPGVERRRYGRDGGPSGHDESTDSDPCGRRSHVRRVPDLSIPCAFDVRSRSVPRSRRDRAMEATRPDLHVRRSADHRMVS